MFLEVKVLMSFVVTALKITQPVSAFTLSESKSETRVHVRYADMRVKPEVEYFAHNYLSGEFSGDFFNLGTFRMRGNVEIFQDRSQSVRFGVTKFFTAGIFEILNETKLKVHIDAEHQIFFKRKRRIYGTRLNYKWPPQPTSRLKNSFLVRNYQ